VSLAYASESAAAPSAQAKAAPKQRAVTSRRQPAPARDSARPSVAVAPRPAPEPETGGQFNTESYDEVSESSFVRVADKPLSTFAVDVDTASYSNVRRFLRGSHLPPPGAVRIEEMVNYFSYEYAQPDGVTPFSITTEASVCPWNKAHRLVHVGLQGRSLPPGQVPARNLVFLLDVSGSMRSHDKLPLLKDGLRLLVNQLEARDRVAIVVYAGASGLVLPSTPGSDRERILGALSRLGAGGSTNGGAGIRLAYNVARKQFRRGGINRVILATDGDFNVGTTNQSELVRLIEKERESGVFLTVLGFGTGNYKDSTMEKLADKGNGNYAYIDDIAEARKVLVREAGSTLVTIAKDVKIQVEFNPTRVKAYRLIGYENRLLRDRDFNDDTKDAGELGAGHTVTALYEIVPAGAKSAVIGVDPLKYQKPRKTSRAAASGELMNIKLRYKRPDGARSTLVTHALRDKHRALDATSDNYRLSAAIAAFGMLLRGSEHKGTASYAMARELAAGARGSDPHGYRAQLVDLIERAASLSPETQAKAQAVAR
jgi:Ca-activated chloride channel family protein